MKAIRYEDHGSADVLRWSEIPDPDPGPGEVLVRIQAAGVNHLDIHVRRGIPGLKTPLPHTPGCDGAGVVEAVGCDVTQFAPGDRVAVNPNISCGSCERCAAGEITLCAQYRILGEHTDGTYAELIALPERNLFRIPDSEDFTVVAAAPLTYMTAWSMVVGKAGVKPGDTVLVMGAGSGVSIAAIQIAAMMGARIITTAGTRAKAERARELPGVDHVILYTQTPLDKEVRSITNRRGVDVVIDHVGGASWVPLLRSLRAGGTLVTCGATGGHDPAEDLRQIFYRQIRVLGSTMGNGAEMAAVMKLVFKGVLRPVIDEVFPLSEAAAAHLKIEARKVFGKIVLAA